MKFFIGIVPPLVTKERIYNFQKSFPSNKVPYFNEPHITIKAPSGLTEDRHWLIKLMTIIGNYPRFQIKLEALGNFDNKVLFLEPVFSEELINLYMKLIEFLNPDGEAREKFFEGLMYHPHLTLGETTWGGMSEEELEVMKKRAGFELFDIPVFQVDFVRVYKKEEGDELYQKFIDIPLKL